MKNKVNVEELTAALNNFIQSSKNKTFTRQEIGEKISSFTYFLFTLSFVSFVSSA